MNIDPAFRASLLWRVAAATVNPVGDILPPWNDLPAEVKTLVVRGVEALEGGDRAGSVISLAFQGAGWKMGIWSLEEKTCVFVDTTKPAGTVAWSAGVAVIDVVKEI